MSDLKSVFQWATSIKQALDSFARRGQARDEAQRIEAGLVGLLEKRGFRTLLNWVPPREADDAGEANLIVALDGQLFVIEVKSTFMPRSQREAWLHVTTTLRKAGQQLRRKAEAVSLAIASYPGFRTMLGWTECLIPTQQHVWIADTCSCFIRPVDSIVNGEQSSWLVQQVAITAKRDDQLFDGDLQKTAEPLVIALDVASSARRGETIAGAPARTNVALASLA